MIAVLLVLLVALCERPVRGLNKTIYAYLGKTPVLDGRIDPAEWADAYSEHGILGWDPEFQPVAHTTPVDLNLSLWVKHDRTHLYFAFQVTDDVLYGFQTPSWLPSGNAEANNLTQQVRLWEML